jgi:hypothetical protein
MCKDKEQTPLAVFHHKETQNKALHLAIILRENEMSV